MTNRKLKNRYKVKMNLNLILILQISELQHHKMNQMPSQRNQAKTFNYKNE